MTPSDKTPYDISDLPGGLLYKIGFSQANIVPLWIFITWFTFLIVSFIAVAISQNSLLTFICFTLLFLPAGLFLFGLLVRKRVYPKAVATFANKNKLQALKADDKAVRIPPCIYSEAAHGQKLNGYYFQTDSESVLIYDCSYKQKTENSEQTLQYSVAAIPLTKSYPHIFLDGKANGRNYQYAEGQQIQLEGDFNEHFSLYIPKDSQVGALAILSPDVMQTLVNQAKAHDVEIDGNVAYVVSEGLAFTKENFESNLAVATALSKELTHLDHTWQPVYSAENKPFVLKRSRFELYLAIVIGFIAFSIFLQLLAAALLH